MTRSTFLIGCDVKLIGTRDTNVCIETIITIICACQTITILKVRSVLTKIES